jgi:microcystin-dependent protein
LSATTPTNFYTGEQWYDTTNGQLKLYTGTEWRLIGPLSRLVTGNTGAIPDTVTDAPPSTTFVVIKIFIDNVLVGIWSDDGPFASDVAGFATIKKGLNLNSTLDHKFWGNSEVADSLYVNGVAYQGNTFVRNDVSGTINGSLILTNDGGITFGAASDFVGSVNAGVVTLRNQTNNSDFILSVRSGGVQTSFLRGNSTTGLAEAFNSPVASSPALSFATKNYVDILSGSVNGTASFFGHITPSINALYTLGNVTNTWSNLFAQSSVIGNVYATNTFATISNVAQIYVSADITPATNNTSNIGSVGMQFNSIIARSVSLTTTIVAGGNLTIGGNSTVANNSSVGGNFSAVGNISTSTTTAATSTSTGALTVAGGAGIAGGLYVGGLLSTPMITLPTVGNASILGNLTPGANVFYTLGNVSNRWTNIFSESILVGNVNAANIAATNANIAQIFLGADIIPTANTSSNIGSVGRQFDTLHARTLALIGNANVGVNLGVSGNSSITGTSTVGGNTTLGANLAVIGNAAITAATTSTSTTTGALVVAGGAGIAGNLNVGLVVTAPTLPTGTANTALATTAFVASSITPIGSLIMWPTASAPSGYLLCNGSAVSRVTYAALFAVIGTTFGAGDNSTTFNLPNYTNRLPVGAGGLYGLSTTGGTKDANVVSHTHTLSGGGVSGTFVTGVSTTTSSFQTFGSTAVTSVSTTTGSPSYSNPTVQSSGSSGTDQNMPPYLAINFIIKF